MANAKTRTRNGYGAGPGGGRWCPRADAKESANARRRAEDVNEARAALDELAALEQELRPEFDDTADLRRLLLAISRYRYARRVEEGQATAEQALYALQDEIEGRLEAARRKREGD